MGKVLHALFCTKKARNNRLPQETRENLLMRTNLVEYENSISSDNEAHHQNCEAMEIPNPKKESGKDPFFQSKTRNAARLLF